jgi:hypothetical protein
MKASRKNETWIIEAGDSVIRKKASHGAAALTPLERLVYCLWVADYGMRNAGDLDTAHDVYADFHNEAERLASELSLNHTRDAFALTKEALQQQYFERFDGICDEIKRVHGGRTASRPDTEH